METIVILAPNSHGRIIRWHPREGAKLIEDQIIATAIDINDCNLDICAVGLGTKGIFKKILVEKDSAFTPGQALAEVSVCTHPVFYNNLCGSCGDRDVAINKSRDGIIIKPSVILSGGKSIRLSEKEASKMKGDALFYFVVLI